MKLQISIIICVFCAAISYSNSNCYYCGTYYGGDGLVNTTLTLKEDKSFKLLVEWDAGIPHEIWGSFQVNETSIELLVSRYTRGALIFLPQNLVIVQWSDRLYLIEELDLVNFCFDINNGIEPRSDGIGSVLLRLGDHRKQVTQNPSLPERCLKCLFPDLVSGQIVANKTRKRVIVEMEVPIPFCAGLPFYVCNKENEFIGILLLTAKEGDRYIFANPYNMDIDEGFFVKSRI